MKNKTKSMPDKMSAEAYRQMQATAINTRNPFYRFLTAEDKEHAEFLNYCKVTYPDLIVIHTPSEGRRTQFERYKASLLGLTKGVPDFIIPRKMGVFNGLVIEMKATGKKIYLKDGKTFVADETIRRQAAMIERFRLEGWMGTFSLGISEAKQILAIYLQKL